MTIITSPALVAVSDVLTWNLGENERIGDQETLSLENGNFIIARTISNASGLYSVEGGIFSASGDLLTEFQIDTPDEYRRYENVGIYFSQTLERLELNQTGGVDIHWSLVNQSNEPSGNFVSTFDISGTQVGDVRDAPVFALDTEDTRHFISPDGVHLFSWVEDSTLYVSVYDRNGEQISDRVPVASDIQDVSDIIFTDNGGFSALWIDVGYRSTRGQIFEVSDYFGSNIVEYYFTGGGVRGSAPEIERLHLSPSGQYFVTFDHASEYIPGNLSYHLSEIWHLGSDGSLAPIRATFHSYPDYYSGFQQFYDEIEVLFLEDGEVLIYSDEYFADSPNRVYSYDNEQISFYEFEQFQPPSPGAESSLTVLNGGLVAFDEALLGDAGSTRYQLFQANNHPSGNLIIQGDLISNGEVYVDTSSIVDPDGVGEFQYSWSLSASWDTYGEAISTGQTYVLSESDVASRLHVEVTYVDGGGATETFSVYSGFIGGVFEGTDGDDDINGSVGPDIIDGNLGNDTISGISRDYNVAGSGRPDSISGGDGDDVISGFGLFWGEAGNDSLTGTEDGTQLDGGSGNDTLSGIAADFVGGDGDDLFQPQGSGYHVQPGLGFDTVVLNSNVSTVSGSREDLNGDSILGFSRNTLLTFTDVSFDVYDYTLELTGDFGVLSFDFDGDGTFEFQMHLDFISENLDYETNIFEIDGLLSFRFSALSVPESLTSGQTIEVQSRFGYTLSGGVGNDTIVGGAEDDVIRAGAGDDSIYGGPGNDNLAGEDQDDFIDSGLGSDLVGGGNGNDTITVSEASFEDVNRVWAGAGNDRINGNISRDIIDGGDGNDTIIGEAGDDVLIGGTSEEDVRDQIYGGDGNDSIDGGYGNDQLRGDAGNDTIFGSYGDDVIFGYVGDDFLDGGDGNDIIVPSFGSDTIYGGFGNDSISVGDANETDLNRIWGGEGNDAITGGRSMDSIYAGDGTDTVIGGDGDDTIFGGDSEADLRDMIYGGNGNDSADGGYGNDELRGDAGNDTLIGGYGADTVIGGDGDDVLTAQAWGDVLYGGNGNDFINGGYGYDRANGGAGADRFYHLGVEGHGSDWIQDYDAAEGDVLVFGGSATRDQFQVNLVETANAGIAGVEEAFVIYRPTGQILWALVDGGAQVEINLVISGTEYDLLA